MAAWAPGGGVFSLGVRVTWEAGVAVGREGGKGQLAPVLWLKSQSLGKTICVWGSAVVTSGVRVSWVKGRGRKSQMQDPALLLSGIDYLENSLQKRKWMFVKFSGNIQSYNEVAVRFYSP